NSRGFAIGLLPVKWNYIVTNEYLRNDFVLDEGLGAKYNLAETGNVKEIKGKQLFGLQEIQQAKEKQNNPSSILLKLLGTVLLFIFIYFLAIYFLQGGYKPTGVFIYLLILLFL